MQLLASDPRGPGSPLGGVPLFIYSVSFHSPLSPPGPLKGKGFPKEAPFSGWKKIPAKGLICRAPEGTPEGLRRCPQGWHTQLCCCCGPLEWGGVCRGEDAGEARWGCKDRASRDSELKNSQLQKDRPLMVLPGTKICVCLSL